MLLTGSTGHLGRPMARALVDAGANLILSGRDSAKLSELASALAGSAGSCSIAIGDLSTPEMVLRLCDDIHSRCDSLHGLVNNASAGRVGAFGTITAEDFAFSCQHDLIAPFLLVKHLLPLLSRAAEQSGDASIVNVSTMYASVSPYPEVYGDSGLNNPIQYGATKAGLEQMTRYLACHLGPKRIRVNSIAPGPFPDTAGGSRIPDFFEKLAKKVPMQRLGHPEEASFPVVFLLSPAASYINGANIPVDGGWTAW